MHLEYIRFFFFQVQLNWGVAGEKFDSYIKRKESKGSKDWFTFFLIALFDQSSAKVSKSPDFSKILDFSYFY